jgi:hypothetical protein
MRFDLKLLCYIWFSTLVDKIIAIKQSDPQANTSVFKVEVEQLVYQLYNLTFDEISIVEGV